MTEAKAASAAKAPGAAARSERNGKERKLKWRDLTLTLPAQIEDVDGDIFFAMAMADDDPRELASLLRALLGPEQLQKVRSSLRNEKVTFGDLPEVLAPLVEEIFGVYGTDSGESEASTKSSGTTGDS